MQTRRIRPGHHSAGTGEGPTAARPGRRDPDLEDIDPLLLHGSAALVQRHLQRIILGNCSECWSTLNHLEHRLP